MIKILNDRIVLDEGEEVDVPNSILLSNRLLIKCKGEINSYIELQDLLIVLIDTYHASNLFTSLGSNIFCYNKHDGSLKWQVESKEESPYVGVSLNIPDSGERDVNYEVVYKDDSAEVKEIYGIILKEEFRSNIDSLRARTFSCNGYEIDIETGKVKFLYQGK